jgi:hypothetical protein
MALLARQDFRKKQVNDVFRTEAISVLSRLFEMLCNCRRDFKELDQLLDPRFHLEDCLYREKVEPLGIEFKEG